MKQLSIIIGFLFCTGIVQSQITFTSSDFPAPGTSIEYYDCWSDSIDMGMVGSNQVFDFSKALQETYGTFDISFVDPSSTPFASNHPDATAAFISDTELDSATQKVVLEFWQFVEVSSSACTYVGLTVNLDTGNMFNQSPPTSLTPFHSLYVPNMEYMGTNWKYQNTKMVNSSWSVTAGPLKHDETISRNAEIDAWGVFKNPWSSFDALRFRVEEYTSGIDSVNGQVDDIWADTSYYFEYWVNGLGHYIARAHTDASFTSFWGIELANQRVPVGLESQYNAVEFEIYPVPASNEIYIEANIHGIIEHSINDVNGRIIDKGVINSLIGGGNQIDLKGIDHGFYILDLKLQSGAIGRKKFIVE